MTVAELLARISSLELSEWAAYYGIEPWGAERDNLHAGIVASATVNLWRSDSDNPVRPQDYILHFGEPEEVQARPAEDLYEMMHTWAILGGVKPHADDAKDSGRQTDR